MSATFAGRPATKPDQAFEVIEHSNGLETIDLVGSHAVGEENVIVFGDLARLDG